MREHQRRFLAPERLAGAVHLVERGQKTLAHQLGKALGQRVAKQGAVLRHGIVARVGEGKAVLGTLHGCNKGRRLGQNLPQLLGARGGGLQLLGHIQQAHQQVAQLGGGGGPHGLQRGLPVSLRGGVGLLLQVLPVGLQNLGFAVANSQQARRPGIGRGQVMALRQQGCAQSRQGLARPVGGRADAR